LKVTTLGMKRRGDRVNIETDILSKYVTTNLPKVSSSSEDLDLASFSHQDAYK
jgi:riboflavin synthase alpha subunit